MMPNIFDDMDEVHIQKVWDQLGQRFGFPEKNWKSKFKAYLEKQPREVSTPRAFLKFGMDNINPILNNLLLRSPGIDTFNRLVVFVIENSDSYKRKREQRRQISRPR